MEIVPLRLTETLTDGLSILLHNQTMAQQGVSIQTAVTTVYFSQHCKMHITVNTGNYYQNVN
jgi:hypothetical protein